MRTSYLGLGILGLLLLAAGTVFAFQGEGMIGGSVMTGNPFWIYAGSLIAIIGLILAVLGFGYGSKGGGRAQSKAIVHKEGKGNSPQSEEDTSASSR